METTSPKRSIAAAAYMEITEAEMFRFETIRDAYQCARESALAHTQAAKQVTAEVRRLEKVADTLFQEAKRQKKEANNWRERLRYAAADKSVKKEVVGPDSAKDKAS